MTEPIVDAMASWANGVPVPPLADILATYGDEFGGVLRHATPFTRITDLKKMVARQEALFMARQEAVTRFGFVLPSAELLRALKKHEPIIEIGAGSGYMTKLMRNAGISVVGSDTKDQHYGFNHGEHDQDQRKMSAVAAVREYPSHSVFCAWPTLGSSWLRYALKAMQPGRYAVLIEEGCCAESSTWRYRDSAFVNTQCIPIPQWPMIRDTAGVWLKNELDGTDNMGH